MNTASGRSFKSACITFWFQRWQEPTSFSLTPSGAEVERTIALRERKDIPSRGFGNQLQRRQPLGRMRAADHGDGQSLATACCAACNPANAGLRRLRIVDTTGLIERLPILRNLQRARNNIHIVRPDVLETGSPGQCAGMIRLLHSRDGRFRDV